MSIEHTIIARSRSHVVGVRALEILGREASKGCTPEFSDKPVSLEPAFAPAGQRSREEPVKHEVFVPVTPELSSDLVRLNCLISSEHTLEWYRAERFLKELSRAGHRVGFEISGNEEEIRIQFLLHNRDLDLLKVAFNGEFSNCHVTPAADHNHFNQNTFFYDFFPASPYHHLQAQPEELQTTPYEGLIRALAQLIPPAQGFLQVLFEPARHDWHQNVDFLTDVEFLGKAIADPYSPYRAQQLPSGELKIMAHQVESKAHFDKPFYFIALRTGIRTAASTCDAWPLTAFVGLIHRDGQPLQFLTERDYLNRFEVKRLQEMFDQGLTYRPGFLLNSSELAGLVHLPGIEEFLEAGVPLVSLETLSLPPQHQHLMSGLEIGTGWYAGKEMSIRINSTMRKTSTHIIGRPGTGKTTTMEHMMLQDLSKGQGLAYIDPHGDSVKRLLHFIPENRIESTIYLDFGDPDWVPLWNPLKRANQQSAGRTADELVAAIKSIVQRNAWGDRLEHILRNGFYGLLHLQDATFLDLLILFEQSQKKHNEKRSQLKKAILQAVDNEVARMFWIRDYEGYRREDFAPPLHKLSKLLTSDETVSLMLTQPDNHIDFVEIMDSDKILLLDLSNLGPDTRGILGCFLLAFLHNTSLLRNKMAPQDRRAFSIYCDEAHKLTTDTLENMIAESRKFGVNLTLAHQFLNQFKPSQRDALSSVGTTIIFNVDRTDAAYLVKDLQDKVEAKDLATLKTGEAIARIYTDIVKIKTPKPKSIPRHNQKEEIIKRSRERYCRKSNEVRDYLRKKQNPTVAHYDWSAHTRESTRLSYDEFE